MKKFIRNISFIVFCLVLLTGNVFAIEINHELLKSFEGIALKDISKSETLKAKSNKHEFHGIKDLETLLGESKQKYKTEFFYFSDDGVTEDKAGVTWYYITPKSGKGKKYYTLYYQDNDVVKLMNEGDLLLVGKKDDENLTIIIAKKYSKSTSKLLKILNMEDVEEEIDVPKVAMQKGDKQSDTSHLAKSEIDVLRNTTTGKLVVNGPATKFYDGDTFVLGELFKIRMQGYDAPEKKQLCEDSKGNDYECGKRSLEALQKLIGKRKVVCVHNGWDKYNRHLFTCRNSMGVEINRQMVVDGMAVSEYSTAYQKDEQAAKEQKKGIWRGKFQRPNAWRKEHKRGK